MFKKSLLVASVLGVGAVASGVAFADAGMSSTYCKPGFYAGVQAGRGDTHYGFEDTLIEAKTYETYHGNTLGASHIDDTGTSGRIYGGYQFNPYFALEAGFTKFHKTDFSVTSYYNNTVVQDRVADTRYDGEVTEQAEDVVGKLTMPFQYNFGGYLKAGLALVSADRHVNESSVHSNGTVIPTGTFYTKSYQAVRPTYGAGIDYTIPNTSLDVDVSYTEIARGDGIPRASLWALGLTDKFA